MEKTFVPGLACIVLVGLLLAVSGCTKEPTPDASEKTKIREPGLVNPGIGKEDQPVAEIAAAFEVGKVIQTHLGEMTEAERYVGDQILFRIRYRNTGKKSAPVTVVDKIPAGLEVVVSRQGGTRDADKGLIVWKVGPVAGGAEGFVEFTAVAREVGTFVNSAAVQIGGELQPGRIVPPFSKLPKTLKNVLVTNTVEVRVVEDPKLGWIPFVKDATPGVGPASNMKEETTVGQMVNFDVPGMYVHALKEKGVTYHRFSIPGQATLLDLGKPDVPILGQILEIPYDVTVSVEVFKSDSLTLDRYNLHPAQKPLPRPNGGAPGSPATSKTSTVPAGTVQPIAKVSPHLGPKVSVTEFAIDGNAYRKNAAFPGALSVVRPADVAVVRGHRLLFLKVFPLQYNPVTRETIAYNNIEVRLKFDRLGQVEPVAPRIVSSRFEDLLHGLVLNYRDPARLREAREPAEAKVGCDYLILTHADTHNADAADDPVTAFANWKRQKGLKVMVEDVSSISGGSTAAGIRTYMENAYRNWSPVPTYVLLVGDADLIPTEYRTTHPSLSPSHLDSAGNQTLIPTDLYYATLDGADHFPDLFIGRIPVDTIAQARTVLDRIRTYERSPPAAAAYYTNEPLVMLFEDTEDPLPVGPPVGNGQEEGSFRIIEFAEAVRTFLQGNGYTVERIYNASSVNVDPARYSDGSALPVELTPAGSPPAVPGFPWSGGAADIQNAINAGRFLVTYDGHGGRRGWGLPSFGVGHFAGLTHGSAAPVVLSFACQTGWFDNETDHADLGTNDECFCEELLTSANGAVAAYGSTRNSYEHNDVMMLGAHQALWPAFTPNPPLSGITLPALRSQRLPRLGQVDLFSKIYMANVYGSGLYRQIAFEMYHVFGDPEMPIWTDEPRRIDVVHPAGIGSTGEQDFVVRVTDHGSGDPVGSADVALTRDGGILTAGETDAGGYIRFKLNAPPATGDIAITVTALDHRPYEGVIRVTDRGSFINRMEPGDGPENQVFHLGGRGFDGNEEVEVTFGAQAGVDATATSGDFGQPGDDFDIQVAAGHALGPVNVIARGKTSGRHAVDVFEVRSANAVDLYLYDQWDSSTWHLHPGDNPTWNNPDIQLYDATTNAPVASNNLVVGTRYRVEAKIHNDTAFDGDNAKVTFKWAPIGAGQTVWQDIDSVPVDVASGATPEAMVDWTPTVTGHTCILAEVYHVEDVETGNQRGQENCHVGPTASPAVVEFAIWNPTDHPAAAFLELRQLTRNDKPVSGRDLWPGMIKHPDPQVLKPGERGQVVVTIDPDRIDAKKGETAEFSLTAFIDDQTIGGVNFIIEKAN